MTQDDFLAAFPEFRAAGAMIPTKLAEATRRVDSSIYGDRTEDAIGYLAAHLLAMSPFGVNLRKEDDKTKSSYLDSFEAIRREVAPSMIVI